MIQHNIYLVLGLSKHHIYQLILKKNLIFLLKNCKYALLLRNIPINEGLPLINFALNKRLALYKKRVLSFPCLILKIDSNLKFYTVFRD